MVEYKEKLNNVFGSLSDQTRRDILKRLSKGSMNVGEIAKHYKLTFAAVSKHIQVLEKARLIIKKRRGKEQIVSIYPHALVAAGKYIDMYKQLWGNRLDSLDVYLQSIK